MHQAGVGSDGQVADAAPRVDAAAVSSFEWPPQMDLHDGVVDHLDVRDGRGWRAGHDSEGRTAGAQGIALPELPSDDVRSMPLPHTSTGQPLVSVEGSNLDGLSDLRGAVRAGRSATVLCALLALIATAEGAYILHTQTVATPPPVAVQEVRRLTPRPPADASSLSLPSKNGSGGPISAASANTAPDGRAIGRARLIVRSDPAGARILVNGRSRGVTPTILADLAPGDHLVTVTLRGKRVEQSVRTEAGSTASVFVSLVTDSASGRLAVSAPVELDIIEDGVLLGTTRTPELMLPAGSHTLRFVNELIGFEHSEEVVIAPDALQRIRVQLPTGTLNINARPWAEVSIDGTVVGETPLGDLKLPLGTHTIVLRHPQFGEQVVPVVVKWGVPGRVSVDMRR